MDDDFIKEAQRMNELYSLNILDTEYEQVFQNIVEMAAIITNSTYSAITLAANDRLWYKARHNVSITEQNRRGSFCERAMQTGDDFFEISDLSQDSEFSKLPEVNSDGGLRFYASKPLITKNGFQLGTICVFDDSSRTLTETQKNQLVILSKQVVSLIELKGNLKIERERSSKEIALMASLNHEIRTPINAILGQVDIMKKTLQRQNQVPCENIEAINSTSTYLAGLVDNNLDYSKLKVGKNQVQLELHNFASLVKQVKNMVSHLTISNSTTVDYEVSDSVPEAIEIDEMVLKQISINLISNAIKFTPGGIVKVLFDYEPLSSQLILDVVDNGMGMSEAEVEKVFTPFTQSSSAKKVNYKGSGLGLTISKELATLLDGEIRVVKSEIGVGTHFRSSLIIPKPVKKEIKEQLTSPSLSCFNEVKKILVVDDARENLYLFQHYLNFLPYEIEAVETYDQAIKNFKENTYDFIFLDIDLGDSSGRDLRREMMKIKPDGKERFVAFTGSCQKEEIENFLCEGFHRHVPKPFNELSLLNAIN